MGSVSKTGRISSDLGPMCAGPRPEVFALPYGRTRNFRRSPHPSRVAISVPGRSRSAERAGFEQRGRAPARDDHVIELVHVDRKRVFNLGYYTWVEQQGVSVEDFDRRKNQDFWRSMVDSIPAWDRLIQDFNAEVGGRNSP